MNGVVTTSPSTADLCTPIMAAAFFPECVHHLTQMNANQSYCSLSGSTLRRGESASVVEEIAASPCCAPSVIPPQRNAGLISRRVVKQKSDRTIHNPLPSPPCNSKGNMRSGVGHPMTCTSVQVYSTHAHGMGGVGRTQSTVSDGMTLLTTTSSHTNTSCPCPPRPSSKDGKGHPVGGFHPLLRHAPRLSYTALQQSMREPSITTPTPLSVPAIHPFEGVGASVRLPRYCSMDFNASLQSVSDECLMAPLSCANAPSSASFAVKPRGAHPSLEKNGTEEKANAHAVRPNAVPMGLEAKAQATGGEEERLGMWCREIRSAGTDSGSVVEEIDGVEEMEEMEEMEGELRRDSAGRVSLPLNAPLEESSQYVMRPDLPEGITGVRIVRRKTLNNHHNVLM